MATRRWLGTAKNVTEIKTITIASTWATGDTLTVTINNIEATITIGSLTTTAQVATTLYQAWTGTTLTDTTASCSPTIADGGFQSIPEFYELNPSSPGASVVTFTCRTSGKPVTWSVSETTAGSGTATGATGTAATGKNFFSNQDNWSGNTVPVDGDDIVFDSGEVDCKYDLSPAIQPGTVTITQGYTGRIGLAAINADDSARKYYEYRTQYLTFDSNASTCTYKIGQGDGQGSRRIKIDAGAGQSTVVVYNTGARNESDFPTFLFTGTHASNTFTIFNGDAGIAFVAGETATIATLRCGGDATSSAKLIVGSGATLTTVVVTGLGTLQLNSNCTTLTQTGATVEYYAGSPATATIWSGTLRYLSTSTIGTGCTIGGAGLLDRSSETRAATITPKISMYKGARLLDPNGTLTLTGGWQAVGCQDADIVTSLGYNRSYTVT